jgi:hypothetical protein
MTKLSTPYSDFYKNGRIATAMCLSTNEEVAKDDDYILLFGGCSIEADCNDILLIPIHEILNDENFSEITEIM